MLISRSSPAPLARPSTLAPYGWHGARVARRSDPVERRDRAGQLGGGSLLRRSRFGRPGCGSGPGPGTRCGSRPASQPTGSAQTPTRTKRPAASSANGSAWSCWSSGRGSARETCRQRRARRATRRPRLCGGNGDSTGWPPATPGPTSPRPSSTAWRPRPGDGRCSAFACAAASSSARCWLWTASGCGRSSPRRGSPSATTRPTPILSTPATGSETRSCPCCGS